MVYDLNPRGALR